MDREQRIKQLRSELDALYMERKDELRKRRAARKLAAEHGRMQRVAAVARRPKPRAVLSTSRKPDVRGDLHPLDVMRQYSYKHILPRELVPEVRIPVFDLRSLRIQTMYAKSPELMDKEHCADLWKMFRRDMSAHWNG